MSFSTGSGTSTMVPTLSPEQNQMLQLQTQQNANTIYPAVTAGLGNLTSAYNQSSNGINNAAQNLAGTAAQAQNTLGSTGESALRTGISGLENLYSPAYQAQQLQTALMPAEAQYAQNIAGQNAQFGGAGEIGSSRQYLAGQQAAGATQASQMQTAAQVANNIAQQQQAAGTSLISAGQSGLTGAQGAAQNQLAASQVPWSQAMQYLSSIYGTPGLNTNPNFAGTQAQTTTANNTTYGIGKTN